jgi:hypothetical protein
MRPSSFRSIARGGLPALLTALLLLVPLHVAAQERVQRDRGRTRGYVRYNARLLSQPSPPPLRRGEFADHPQARARMRGAPDAILYFPPAAAAGNTPRAGSRQAPRGRGVRSDDRGIRKRPGVRGDRTGSPSEPAAWRLRFDDTAGALTGSEWAWLSEARVTLAAVGSGQSSATRRGGGGGGRAALFGAHHLDLRLPAGVDDDADDDGLPDAVESLHMRVLPAMAPGSDGAGRRGNPLHEAPTEIGENAMYEGEARAGDDPGDLDGDGYSDAVIVLDLVSDDAQPPLPSGLERLQVHLIVSAAGPGGGAGKAHMLVFLPARSGERPSRPGADVVADRTSMSISLPGAGRGG